MNLKIGTWYEQIGTPKSTTTSHQAGIDYCIVSQNNAEAYSIVRIKPWIKKTTTGIGMYNLDSLSGKIIVNETKNFTSKYDLRNTVNNIKNYMTDKYPYMRTGGSGTSDGSYYFEFKLKHQDNGQLKNVKIYALLPFRNSGTGRDWEIDFNIDLPTIPRASKFNNIPNFVFDENEGIGKIFSVPLNRYYNGFTNNLEISITNDINTILVATRNNYNNNEVTFTTDEVNNIYQKYNELDINSNTAKFKFESKTYSADNYIGNDIAYSYGTINELGRNPIINLNSLDYLSDYTTQDKTIIKGVSSLRILLSEKAISTKGSKLGINSYIFETANKEKIYVNDSSIPITEPNYDFSWSSFDSNYFTLRVVDSRGNQTLIEKRVELYDYFKPVINSFKIERNDGIERDIYLSFNGEVCSRIDGYNSNSIGFNYLRYKLYQSTDEWIYVPTDLLEINYDQLSGEFALDRIKILELDIENKYDFEINLIDKVYRVAYGYQLLRDATPFIGLDKQDKTLAIGGIPNRNLPTGAIQSYGGFYDKNGNEMSAGGDTLPIGAVVEWYDTVAPENYLLLGSNFDKTVYPELFNKVGKYCTLVSGNIYKLPTKAGLVTVGLDTTQTEFNNIGKIGGSKSYMLQKNQIPSIDIGVVYGANNKPVNLNVTGNANAYGLTNWNGTAINSTPELVARYVNNSQKELNSLQPYTVNNYIIKAKMYSSQITQGMVIDNVDSDSTTNALSAKQGKVLNEKINGIIESGSNSNGSWTKFTDGTMICTSKTTKNISNNISWNGFYIGEINNLPFPQTFTTLYSCNVDIYSYKNLWKMSGNFASTSGTNSFYTISPESYSNAEVTFSIIAIGKWK